MESKIEFGEGQDKEKIWDEILSMIRGTHPSCKGNPQYLFGIEEGYGLRFVSVKDIYHCLVAGITGSGKSRWLLSQIIQDILRGNAVFIFDPHGDLAEMVLSHVPRERWDDVVYVNPLTAKYFGRVVRYNFLEVKENEEPTFVKRAFMDALQKNYPDFWGPRLDAILSHAIDLLFEHPRRKPTLPDLGRVLSKKTFRESLLKECRNEMVRDFWHLTFPMYRDDAITAAQNKLYRILEEALIEPITSADHSTIDFWNLMQGGKIVIFDLREGALTSEITNFIGTLFLARIYQAGMAREKLPEEERKYVRVYVDEAGRFMTHVLRENMQALRKYNVFLTVVCQSLEQFEVKGADLSQYANTIVAFQCAHDTAKALEGFFPKLPAERPDLRHEHLERAKLYHFYVSTFIGTKRENYYLKSIDPGIGPNKPEEVIAHSLKLYGEPYDIRIRRPTIELPQPEIGAAAYAALTELEYRGEISEESLQDKLTKFEKTAIVDALFTLKDRGFATYEWKRARTGHAGQRFWSITEEGIKFLYPTAEIWNNRLGGAKHIAMLCLAAKLYREAGYYPAIVTGRREYDRVRVGETEVKIDLYPDIVLYPRYQMTPTKANPVAWDVTRAAAVEIEAYPTGGKHTGAHLDRTKAHFIKARDMLKMPCIFVVMTDAEAEAVKRALKEEGAKIVGDVFLDYAPGNVTIKVLGREYEEQIKKGMRVGTNLALQVKRLVEMSRQADISEVAEPEDFYEGEPIPPYAKHSELVKIKEVPEVGIELEVKPTIEELPPVKVEPVKEEITKETPRSEEAKPEPSIDLGTLSRVAAKVAKLKSEGGWTFYVEKLRGKLGDVEMLLAWKIVDHEVTKVQIGHYDDICKEILRELEIELGSPPPILPQIPQLPQTPQPQAESPKPETPPAPEKPESIPKIPEGKIDLKKKIAELKQAGARWVIRRIKNKEYCYARIRTEEGKRKEMSLGLLDDELKRLLQEEGIIALESE